MAIVLSVVGRSSLTLSHVVPPSAQYPIDATPDYDMVQRDPGPTPDQEIERTTTPHSPQGALITAAVRGDVDGVRRALAHGADINGRSPAGHTALIVAAAQGQTATVQYLIARNADINAQGPNGGTALIAAARRWHEEVVQWLLDHGAEVQARTRFHVTALIAALSGEGFVYDATLNVYEAKQFVITHDAIPQVQRLITILLDHGADINGRNMKGKTPLRLAVETGHNELVQTLLQHGAQVHDKAKDGQTALMVAQARNLSDIVSLLQQAGALH